MNSYLDIKIAWEKDDILKNLSDILDDVKQRKAWGGVTVTFQNGCIRTIKKEETIVKPRLASDLKNETRKSN
jgi:hypothetical protein